MKNVVIAILCLFFIHVSQGQSKQTTHVQQIWGAYFNQTRFSDKWGLWADLHLRTKEDFATNFSQSILRFGLTYYLNDATRLTAGYAYVTQYPAEGHRETAVPEHRPWQQIQWNSRYPRVGIGQGLRLEERYRRKIRNDSSLAAGYNFNYRLRYNFLLSVPLGRKNAAAKSWSYVFNDEVHVNFGKEVVYNYFDQNRFFMGFAYNTNATDNIQVGYLNVFQQLGAGNRYRSTHALRIFYFHNLDLRKNKGG